MRDLNRVTLIGRATTDLEVKQIGDNNTSVVNFSLATNRSYKNKQGNRVEDAEFHRCTAFGKTAEILGQYLNKGNRVYVEGRLQTRQWEDSNGNNRYTTEVIIRNFIFLDSKSDQVPSSANSKDDAKDVSTTDTDVDDDLPF